MVQKMMVIDADALFKCDTCYHKQNGKCTTFCDSAESYRPDMSKLEIIEAEPVRHGYWIDKLGDGDLYCSECGAVLEKHEHINHNLYYCYHCGAKMDGGENK